MKTNGLGSGAVTAEYPKRAGQTKTAQNEKAFEPEKEQNAYVKRPAPVTLGRESVLDSFARMTQGCSGAYRAMAALEEDLTDRAGSDKEAMASLWQEYEGLLPEGGQTGPEAKPETESKIIVKPDGTRVLVITVKTNAVVTKVFSMKISEPTEEPNESGQEGASEADQEGIDETGQETEGAESGPAVTAGQLEGLVEEGE